MESGRRSREALIESGALVPAPHAENLLDVIATTAGARGTLADVLDEMRNE